MRFVVPSIPPRDDHQERPKRKRRGAAWMRREIAKLPPKHGTRHEHPFSYTAVADPRPSDPATARAWVRLLGFAYLVHQPLYKTLHAARVDGVRLRWRDDHLQLWPITPRFIPEPYRPILAQLLAHVADLERADDQRERKETA